MRRERKARRHPQTAWDGERAAAKFVVFDACRNELQLPTKDTSKGLVPVSEQQGMFIAYASAPGRTASDRGETSGPYAAALAAELAKPGVDHLSLFQNVKEAVYAASGGAQQPWESNGLLRRIYLSGQQPALGQPQAPMASVRLSEAAEGWDRTKDAASVAVLEAFIARYGATFYADLARARIDDLKQQQQAAPGPSSKQPAPKHEQSATMLRCESYAGRSAVPRTATAPGPTATSNVKGRAAVWPQRRLQPRLRQIRSRRHPPATRRVLDTRSTGFQVSAAQPWEATRLALMRPSLIQPWRLAHVSVTAIWVVWHSTSAWCTASARFTAAWRGAHRWAATSPVSSRPARELR